MRQLGACLAILSLLVGTAATGTCLSDEPCAEDRCCESSHEPVETPLPDQCPTGLDCSCCVHLRPAPLAPGLLVPAPTQAPRLLPETPPGPPSSPAPREILHVPRARAARA